MTATRQRTSKEQGYGAQHKRTRATWAPIVAQGATGCVRCGELILPGEAWHLDHTDDRSGYFGPAHKRCNLAAGGLKGTDRIQVAEGEPHGFPVDSEVWDGAAWLDELRELPAEATWPRLMTAPHPAAVGSVGGEVIDAAAARTGRPFRWWQRLVTTRLLEVDADGRLVWASAILTMARQCGKSWWLRELLLWRLQQTGRFGEPQVIVHTGKDLPVCRDVQRPVRIWARDQDHFTVYEANGRESIELDDGSRWVIKARTGVYGLSAGLAAVDEGWKVSASAVDDGIEPTMVEREQPQLLLVSTAHRAATSLMLNRRRAAFDTLDAPESVLLVEWSAPRNAQLEDRDGWRAASPHWTAQREGMISAALARARGGGQLDVDEPDPVEAFRAQWLNQWPLVLQRAAPAEVLIDRARWDGLAGVGVADGPAFVGLEDHYGLGAAVGCARRLADGRWEVDGWPRGDWDSAVADVQALADGGGVRRVLVGASLFDRLPMGLRGIADARHGAHTRLGLVLLRDLAATGQVCHDVVTAELDDAVTKATVRETTSGLVLLPLGAPHLVRAVVWALLAAHRPPPDPAVH
jgi:hypothetical protein